MDIFSPLKHITPSLRREDPQRPFLSYLGLNIWKMIEEACASGLLACQMLECMREIIEKVAN